jgi:hypothetical protein
MTAVAVVARDLLAVTLTVAGAAKLRAPEAAGRAIYSLFEVAASRRKAGAVGRAIAGGEVTLGLALITDVVSTVSGAVAIVTTAIFLLTSLYGLVRHRGKDCGCFGDLGPSSYSGAMVFRNGVLVVAAVIAWQGTRSDVPSAYIPLLTFVGILVVCISVSAADAAAAVRELKGGTR